MKRLVLLIVLLGLLLSGCWDYQDIDKHVIVLALGIDKGDTTRYRVTTQFIISHVGGAGGPEGGGVVYRNVSGEGDSIESALNSIAATLSRGIRLGHVKLIIIGEDLAKEGLDQLQWLVKSREIATRSFVAIAEGKAEDVIKAETEAEAIPILFLYHVFEGRYNKTLEALDIRLWEFWRTSFTDYQDWIMPRVTDEIYGMNYDGAAISTDGRLVGWLDPEETALLHMFLHSKPYRYTAFMLNLPADEGWIAGRLSGIEGEHGVIINQDGVPILTTTLSIDFILRETAPKGVGLDYTFIEMEKMLENAIAESVIKMIAKLQSFESDPLGFGERLRRKDPHSPYLVDWHKKYRELEHKTEVKVTIVSENRVR